MTKEDYMKLSKERLAELLVERDREQSTIIPKIGSTPQCFEQNGVCANPQMDCINCPRRNKGVGDWSVITTTKPIKLK